MFLWSIWYKSFDDTIESQNLEEYKMLFMKVETYANKHSLEILVVCEKGILLYSKTKPNMGPLGWRRTICGLMQKLDVIR